MIYMEIMPEMKPVYMFCVQTAYIVHELGKKFGFKVKYIVCNPIF
jgi:hypothetical protein